MFCFPAPVKIGIAPLCCGGADIATMVHSEVVDMILIVRISEEEDFVFPLKVEDFFGVCLKRHVKL